MNQQVFIVHNKQIIRDPELEPKTLHEVLLADTNGTLATRAKALSKDGLAMAVLEYESDSLKIWVFKNGVLEVEYNSSPTFATCTITPPEGHQLEQLAALYGVPEQTKAIQQLLSRKRGYGFLNEQQRLEKLLALLRLTVPN